MESPLAKLVGEDELSGLSAERQGATAKHLTHQSRRVQGWEENLSGTLRVGGTQGRPVWPACTK